MDKRSFKGRYPLVFATIVSFLSVCTAAVSTFAWFQAEANVNVQAAEASATIKVTKTLDWSIYAYKGNYASNDPSNAVVGYTTPFSPVSFTNDFYMIDTDAKQTLGMSTTNLWPGKKLTYCIAVSGVRKSNIHLTLTSFTSELATATGDRLERRIYNAGETTTKIDIGWAMNIYADAASATTNYSRFLNKRLLDNTNTLGDKLQYSPGTAIATKSDLANVLVNTADIVNNQVYLFYTIEYDNSTGSFLEEVDGSDGHSIVTPPDTGIRWFQSYSVNDKGNSNCYEGLGFSITGLTVTEENS